VSLVTVVSRETRPGVGKYANQGLQGRSRQATDLNLLQAMIVGTGPVLCRPIFSEVAEIGVV
jgi:hypothetical protein